MLSGTTFGASPLARNIADDPEGWPVVVVVGELATYMCRSGDIRPFAQEKPISADVLGKPPPTATESDNDATNSSREEAHSFLLSRLRRHLSHRNIILVAPVRSTLEWHEKLVVFCFEKLQVRTLVMLSDFVADAFAVGCRNALVLHASPSAISIGRVEAGVTVKQATMSYGQLSPLMCETTGDIKHNVLTQQHANAGTNCREGDNQTRESVSSGTAAIPGKLPSDDSVFSSVFSAASPKVVDLLDEVHHDALASLVGENVYNRVVSSMREGRPNQRKLRATKRDRASNSGGRRSSRNGRVNAAANVSENSSKRSLIDISSSGGDEGGESEEDDGEGPLIRLILSVAGREPVPVIIAGEALRVAPSLQKFLEEAVRACGTSHMKRACNDDSNSSSSSSTASSSSSSGGASSFSSSLSTPSDGQEVLKIQPLPIGELPWELSLLGGSLVSQLPMLELCKLYISREDALSSKGSIIRWRSVNNSGSRAPLERSLRWKRKGSERESEVKGEEGVPIFVTKMLFWCRHVSCLLSRRRHVQYTSRGEVERLRKTAILESAAEMPLHTRSTTEPRLLLSTTCSTSNTTSAIRILDETIEAMRSSLGTQSGKRAVYAASRAFKVSSLSHFITECRRLRRQIGECRDTNNRVLLRQTLRNFWTDNVDGALACCALRGRDFGFVAGLGLADDGLHVSFTALNLAVCSVTQEKNTCTCTDMVLSLHYVARELNFIERMHRREPDPHKGKKFERKKGIRDDRNSPNGEGTSNSNKEIGRGGPTQEELQHLRRTVATLGLERIHYFFLQRDASGAVLGTAEDALHVLEFLSIVDIDDAEDSARVLFEATKPRSRKKIYQFAVTSLLRHVVSNCKDLKFTSVVHAFRLLRIFLPVTCPDSPTKLSPPPPLPPRTKDWKSSINSAAPRVLSHTIDAFRGDPHDETVFVSGGAEYLEWKRQLETMDRILWGLFAALQKKDARFINAFHFVQIVETLSRLPRHLLSRVPQPKRGRPQGVGGTMVSNPTLEAAAVHAAHSGNRSSDREVISLEELWAYMVAKACIFIPGMTSDQRRRVCYNLRVAVMSRAVCFQCEVEDMLQPMAHELSQYPKDFDAVMFDRASPGGARGCYYTGSGA